MTNKTPDSQSYAVWLAEIKNKITNAQVRATLSANRELIFFYWELGKMISQKITEHSWGTDVIGQLAKDLTSEFSAIKGFSRRNLYYMKKFYEYFKEVEIEMSIVPQAVAQSDNKIVPQSVAQNIPSVIEKFCARIPWGHLRVILDTIKKPEIAMFYLQQIIENSWSRNTLSLQIKSDLYARKGKAVTNFNNTLPDSQSELAKQTVKDPYCFDFLSLTQPYNERDIENQLVEHITKFLLELGKGFAFLGKQYHLEIAENDYYLDLLFYHVHLKCYIVVELKNTKFIPEYAGKLNFYLSAVDTLLKTETDNPSIGILLCRDKNKIETEFALRDINKPMGVSEFTLTEIVPDNLKGSLPTIEEVEAELMKIKKT